MGDMMQFDPASANHNEKALYALLSDRRAEINDLAHEFARERDVTNAWANKTNAKLDSVAGSVAALDDAHVLLVELKTAIATLKLRLFGDEEMRAKWEQAQKTGTYPNYPGGDKIVEPAPGELDQIRGSVLALGAYVGSVDEENKGLSELLTKLTKTLGASDHNFTFLKKLEAFFGPLIEGKNPPLDGNQIATKGYVDNAVERIAGRIREQVNQAIEVTNAIHRYVAAPLNLVVDEIGKRIAFVIDREYARISAEERRRHQPSRVESLFHALTGRNGGGQ